MLRAVGILISRLTEVSSSRITRRRTEELSDGVRQCNPKFKDTLDYYGNADMALVAYCRILCYGWFTGGFLNRTEMELRGPNFNTLLKGLMKVINGDLRERISDTEKCFLMV